MSENPNPNGPQAGVTPDGGSGGEGGVTSPEQLGEGGVKALHAEREARKAADTKAATLQKQIDDLNAKLSDAAKANDDRPELEKRLATMQEQIEASAAALKAAEENAAKANLAQLRTDRAAAKGLPAPLAKKLTGSTAEELDAEIDELLPLLQPGGVRPNPQQGNPSQARGGSLAAGRERYAAANK